MSSHNSPIGGALLGSPSSRHREAGGLVTGPIGGQWLSQDLPQAVQSPAGGMALHRPCPLSCRGLHEGCHCPHTRHRLADQVSRPCVTWLGEAPPGDPLGPSLAVRLWKSYSPPQRTREVIGRKHSAAQSPARCSERAHSCCYCCHLFIQQTSPTSPCPKASQSQDGKRSGGWA